MSAPVHTQPRSAPRGRADTRLPWWALALPTLAFIALLSLILDPSEAQTATADPMLPRLLEQVRDLAVR